MKKKILLSLAAVVAVIAGVAAFSAFEAHIINVTAHIENALAVDTYGIDFGTVFPQEFLEDTFTISLSQSFIDESEADTVDYKIVQKPKYWRDDFEEGVSPEHRSLHWVDPDNGDSGYTETGGKLTIYTGYDEEDLFGANEDPHDWTAPRKVMRLGGNFTIETKVTADPTDYPGADGLYQSGGILVYGSDGNVVRLELTRFTGLGPANAVYMESQIAAVKTGKGWNGVGENDTVYLRLSRNGNTFSGEYSTDGTVWNPVTTQEGNFENASVGRYPLVGLAVVDNDGDDTPGSGFTADFDYVEINGSYQDFCRFLSKMDADPNDNNDTSHPSYYDDNGTPEDTSDDTCITVERYDNELAFSPGGWAGWSCPAGTHVVGGGYEAGASVAISEAAQLGSASGLYPVYPHYTFPAGETGWVIQNDNDNETISYYVLCLAYPEATGVLTKSEDPTDLWTVDLKVPPIAGYVGQDWPASCQQDWVVPEEADYGCDLWIEVTGIGRQP